jgi:penicillin-binding protein 1A
VLAASTPTPAPARFEHATTLRDLNDDPEAPGAKLIARQTPRKGRFWRRFFATLGIVIGLSGLVATGTLYFLVQKYSEGLPIVQKLKAGYDPPQITRVFARDKSLLASLFTERRTVVKMEQIADVAKLSFLAAEDASFYEHEGLNYLGIARAMVANLRAGHTVQGGSTITQQVVKNILLDSERSLARKVREVLLAGRLEGSLTKDEIFWLYINHIYLGHGRYGIEEAARYYFGKRASELGLDEAATLAGLIAAPQRFSPRRDPENALLRRGYVLKQMLEKRFVTEELYQRVLKLPLRLAPAAEHESELVPEVVAIAKFALKSVAPKAASSGGFELYTTIDPERQAAARAAVRQGLDDYMVRHKLSAPYLATKNSLWAEPLVGTPQAHHIYTGVIAHTDDHTGTIEVQVGDTVGRVALSTETRYNPKGLAPSEFTKPGALLRVGLLEGPAELDGEQTKPQLRLELGPQASLIALDVRTREVLAVVGSYEPLAGGLDRATRTRRQPRSAFKPIAYSYALHSRSFTPATPVAVSKRGHGIAPDAPLQLPVRAALAHSNNEVAVESFKHAGPDQALLALSNELSDPGGDAAGAAACGLAGTPATGVPSAGRSELTSD